MEGELVPGNDGLYCLCIYGGASMSDELITQTFRKYGDIVKLNRSNNLVFLRYQEYEEVKEALDDLKDHAFLKVRMAHNKSNGARPRNDNGRNFGERNNVDPRNDSRRNFTDRNNTDGFRSDTVNSRNSEPRKPRSRTPSFKGGASDDGKESMPPLKFNENNVEGMPNLVPRGEPAKQLIIANLPRSVMQYQVYSLCKNGGPLHVDIFTTDSNITYAHVHVKGSADIEVLEEELNGLVIDDKKLVVLSVDKLLAEHTPSSRTLATSGRKFN